MEQLNRVELRGIVGSVRETEVGDLVHVKMAVATNYAYKSEDGCPVVETTWHSVEKFFDSPQEFVKGDNVEVIGRLKHQRYTRADGSEEIYTYVLASSVKKIDVRLKFQE